MNKKYMWLAIALAVLSCAFPVFVEQLYSLGESHPLVTTYYTPSDILSYSATIVSTWIAVVAIVIAVETPKPHVKIKHALTEDTEGIAVYIELYNVGANDFEVQCFELCNKQRQGFAALSECAPFIIKTNSCKSFTVSIDRMKGYLKSITGTVDANNAEYAVRLSINKTIFLNTGDLEYYLSLGGSEHGTHEI